MRLEGIHHVSAITGDARRNLDFYVRVLGLRLVKKTVDQDVPSIDDLYYGSEQGDSGAILSFFEFPGIQVGRAGAGMVHRLTWRIGSEDALEFWARRLGNEGCEYERSNARLRFRDPEGLELELAIVDTGDEPLTAFHPEIPEELALRGFDSVRAYARDPRRSRELLEGALGFERRSEAAWSVRGETRGGLFVFDSAPVGAGIQGAGTVHHVAWASSLRGHESWHQALVAAGAGVTPVVDRSWFRSFYFREPSGVLFEIATIGPGFGIDEATEQLGRHLVSPPPVEHMRDEIEPASTLLPDPRASRVGR